MNKYQILGTLQATLLLALTYQDIKNKAVSFPLVLVFIGITVGAIILEIFSLDVLVIFSIGILLLMGILLVQKLKGFSPLGLGDVLLLIPMVATLSLQEIPLFFMVAGVIGMLLAGVWQWCYNEKEFPFIPALSLAYGACRWGGIAS